VLISSAIQPTRAYQLRPSANNGISAALLSLTWPNQQRYSVKKGISEALFSQHGLISTAYYPNMGLSAALLSITWAYQQRYSA